MSGKEGVSFFSTTDYELEEIRHELQNSPSKKTTFKRARRSVTFGEWPQTIKDDDVVIYETKDDRGFYLGSDGEYYVKAVAKPYYKGYYFSNKAEIIKGTTYYFKVEPLTWTIIKEEGSRLLVHCNNIIFNKAYQSDYIKDEDGDIITEFNDAPPNTYASNYIYSEIREWLLGTFFPLIEKSFGFDDSQVKILPYYVCDENSPLDFSDKVFLLSKSEVEKYGAGYKPHMRNVTDYAKACGTYVYGAMSGVRSRATGKGWWWLRTPCTSEGQDTVHAIDQNGVTNYAWIWVGGYGIVPALYIDIIKNQDSSSQY